MTGDVGNGNGTVTKGHPGPVWNERLLYGITDKLSVGVNLAWEEHDIKNVDPVSIYFGRSGTLSSMVVLEIYPPLWPSFSSAFDHLHLFPYGLIGLGQNKNFFTESSAFTQNCNPSSACKVALENTLGARFAAGVDYFIAPDLALNAEIGWNLNSGHSHISTTHSEGTITTSRDSYEASTASFLVGLHYFFERPKPPPPAPAPVVGAIHELPLPAPTIPVQMEPEQKVPWMTKEIFFESSSWTITFEGEALLLDVAAYLKSSPETPIEIEGHTDLHGSKEGNMRIGQKRAEAVAEALKKAGVTNEMRVISYGDSRPFSTEDTPEADRLNRRVTIRRLPVKE